MTNIDPSPRLGVLKITNLLEDRTSLGHGLAISRIVQDDFSPFFQTEEIRVVTVVVFPLSHGDKLVGGFALDTRGKEPFRQVEDGGHGEWVLG